MSFVLGLTGSIGMGKSTTAQMFRDLNIPVWDADAAVHELYALGGDAVAEIDRLLPGSGSTGSVDRAQLKRMIADGPELLDEIEAIVHPLLAKDRENFLNSHKTDPLVVLDVPLLFEKGGDANCDATVVVTTDPEEQRRRVFARGTSRETFDKLLSRQLPDAAKRARSTYVIRTDTLDDTRSSVANLVANITEGST